MCLPRPPRRRLSSHPRRSVFSADGRVGTKVRVVPPDQEWSLGAKQDSSVSSSGEREGKTNAKQEAITRPDTYAYASRRSRSCDELLLWRQALGGAANETIQPRAPPRRGAIWQQHRRIERFSNCWKARVEEKEIRNKMPSLNPTPMQPFRPSRRGDQCASKPRNRRDLHRRKKKRER